MKKILKHKKLMIALGGLLSAVALVTASVLVTVALLTSSASVSNVFTVGNVGIQMYESKMDKYGHPVDLNGKHLEEGEPEIPVDTNTYHLVPATSYRKNPYVVVDAGSENSYLFVHIVNGIEDIEDAANNPTIAKQMADNGFARFAKTTTGWLYVYVGFASNENETGVPTDDWQVPVGDFAFDHVNTKPATVKGGKTYKIFETFSIAQNANTESYGLATVTLTAVAVQSSGFTDVKDGVQGIDRAWIAVDQAYANTPDLVIPLVPAN